MMKNAAYYATIVFLVSICPAGHAVVDPPLIQCLSLDENDNATITWSIPADPNAEFFNYTIYYSPGTGIYSPIYQELNYNQNVVVLSGSFAGNASFYVVTYSNGGTQSGPASDTVSPMIVTLFSNDRYIDIHWTALNLPALDSQYRVLRRVDGGVWEVIGIVDFPIRTYVDTVRVCSGTFEYRIELDGVGGCVSSSNVAERTIIDEQAPRQCNIICASVDSVSGAVHLRWEVSKSPDVFGYIIYYFGAFIWQEVVSGDNVSSHTFTTQGINGNIQIEKLSVAPYDSCLNTVTQWYNQAADSLRVKTLFVDTNYVDRCAGKVGLQWNMPDTVNPVGVLSPSSYRVYRKTGAGPLNLLADLTTADSVFLDSGLVPGVNYTYVVSVVDSERGQEAYSNALLFRIKPSKVPNFLHISSIENDHATGLNEIHVFADSSAGVYGYYLFRSQELSGEFQFIEEREEANLGTFVIVDANGSAGQSAFAYKVGAYDECGAVITFSQEAKSIFIDGYKLEKEYTNQLRWTPYVGFESQGTVPEGYQVYRSIAPDEPEWLTTSEDLTYSDDVYNIELAGGRICYYVKAQENGANALGMQETSLSNMFCLDYTPRVFIPTAFSPDGDAINDAFRPDVNFVEPDEYLMRIYDRAGVLVFSTTDPMEGWDGVHHPIGVYAYHIIVRNARSEAIEYSGRVSLVR